MEDRGQSREKLRVALGVCAKNLEKALKEGKSPGVGGAKRRRKHPLRDLQSELKTIEKDGEDRLAMTIAFFLDEWIKDYFLNFAGDVLSPASEAIDNIRKRLMKKLEEEVFERLATALEGNSANVVEPLEELVCSYLEAVRESCQKVPGWCPCL